MVLHLRKARGKASALGAVAAVLLVVGAACRGATPGPPAAPSIPSPPSTVSISPGLVEGRAPVAVAIKGVVYRVEVVRAGEPGYYKGLGERDGLPGDRGMLFLETQDVAMAFWMKGMRFPLDIIWIDREGRIVHLERDVPHQPGAPDSQLRVYRPPVPARAVLELNAGQAAAQGFQVGDRVLFIYE